jgi:hypothetical protein
MNSLLEKISELNSAMVYGLLFLIAVVGSYFLLSLASAGQKLKENATSGGKSKAGGLGCLTVLFLLLVALSFLFFTAYIRAYQAFNQEQLVALVECERATDNTHRFVMKYSSVIKDEPQTPKEFKIVGDQWVVGGDVVKWKSYLNFLGLKSMYRLTRVEGQFVRENNEKSPSTYFLDPKSESTFWDKMYAIGDKLFVVSGVYGAKVYNNPGYGSIYEIYVTEDGYIVKKVTKDGSSIKEQIINKLFDTSTAIEERELKR